MEGALRSPAPKVRSGGAIASLSGRLLSDGKSRQFGKRVSNAIIGAVAFIALAFVREALAQPMLSPGGVVFRNSTMMMGYLAPGQVVDVAGYKNCFTSVGRYLWIWSLNSRNIHPKLEISSVGGQVKITKNENATGYGAYVCYNDSVIDAGVTAGYAKSGTSIGKDLSCVVSIANFVKVRPSGGAIPATLSCSYDPNTGVIQTTTNQAGVLSECGYVCVDKASRKPSKIIAKQFPKIFSGTQDIGTGLQCARGTNFIYSEYTTMGTSEASYNPATGLATRGATSLGDEKQYISFSYLCVDPRRQCADAVDNDGDELTDRDDPGCWTSPQDPTSYDPNLNNESARTSQCQDGLDNDSDGVIDASDPGCWRDLTNSATYDRTLNNEARAQLIGVPTQVFPPQNGSISASELTFDWNGVAGAATYELLVRQTSPQINQVAIRLANLTGTSYTPPTALPRGAYQWFVRAISQAGQVGPWQPADIAYRFQISSQCSDGLDNDRDGAIDLQDFSCSGATDNDEAAPGSQCQNGEDDDRDGLVDLADPGCSSAQDDNEADGTAQCQNGIDDDRDGLVDLADPGCTGPKDNNEGDGTAQCQNGKDDDSDGLIDLNDPGCSCPSDNYEGDGTSQCQNGKDDDQDGLIDVADPGCSSPQDNNEADGTSQCQDGKDNDSDGQIDIQDPGCCSPQDNDERGDATPQPTATPIESATETATPAATATATPTSSWTGMPTGTPEVVSYRVTPIVECVDALENGNLLAHFGYRSDEPSSVIIPVGASNFVAPGNGDAGQPTTFLRGTFSDFFTVVVQAATPQDDDTGTSGVVRWTLGDVTVEASARTQRCAGGETTCNENNNKDILAQLDHLASRQRATVREIADRIRNSSCGWTLKSLADSYESEAERLYLEQSNYIWSSFPQVTKSCTGCAAIDTTSSVMEITERSKKLFRLTKRAALTLRKARRDSARSYDTSRVITGTILHSRTVEVSEQLPRFHSHCG